MASLFDLTGKVIVVTAATSRLATAMVEGLAEYGATLVLAARQKEKAEQLAEHLRLQYAVSCETMYMDITEDASIGALMKHVYTTYGRIDVVVNNVSYGAAGKLEAMDYEAFTKGIDGTINGVFKVTNTVLPYMLRQGFGNFINITSMYGVVSPNPEIYGTTGFDNPVNYGAGKAAIVQFTKYVACNYGAKGIRANCICPGPFPSEKVQQNEWFMQKLSEKTPLGRIGQPNELKGIAVLLASDASSYMTGQNIVVDGGFTSW